MPPRRRLLLGGGVLALVALGAVLAWVAGQGEDASSPLPPSTTAAASSSAAAAPQAAPTWRFVPGRVVTGAFTLSERAEVHVPRQGALPERWEGDMSLRGTLQWVHLGPQPAGGHLVEARWSDVTLERLTLSGAPLPVTAADLNGQSALVTYDDEGRLLRIEVPSRAHPVFANTAERLLRQLQAPWPAAAPPEGWSRDVTAGFGDARWHGALHACAPPRGCEAILRRQADDYAAFSFIPDHLAPDRRSGAATLQAALHPDGYPAAFDLDETLTLARGGDPVADVRYRATWALQGLHSIDPAARRAELDRLGFAPVGTRDAARLDALRKRVGDWTVEQALAQLQTWGASGRLPDHERWLWRTVGLVLLDPAAARALAALAEAPETAAPTRALILEVLGSAGSPPAQAAMRQILQAPGVEADPAYSALLQRLILVEAPEEATVSLLESVYAEGEEVDVRYGAASALGAALSRVAQADPQGAQRRADRLRDDLAAAPDSTGQRALLGALANTRMPGYARDIAAHGDASDPEVRAATANALESIPGEEAILALIRLVQREADPQVQIVAIRALASHPLTPAQLQALAEAVQTSALIPRSVGYLVDTCLAFHRNGLERAGIVAVLLAARPRAAGDPAVAGRVTVALQTLGVAPP